MGDSADTGIIGIILVLVAASVALAATGIWLGRSGRLTSRPLALVWAIAAIAPLFGAGVFMYAHHMAMQAQGETRSGANAVPPGQKR